MSSKKGLFDCVIVLSKMLTNKNEVVYQPSNYN